MSKRRAPEKLGNLAWREMSLSFSKRIKEERLHLNLSIYAVAQRSLLDRTTLARLEDNAKDNPTILTICLLAHALHVTPGYLMGFTDDKL